jgi:hypothetical protein
MTCRREYRRDEDRIDARSGGTADRSSGVSSGGHQPSGSPPVAGRGGVATQRALRPVHAGGAEAKGKTRVAGDEEHQMPPAAERRQAGGKQPAVPPIRLAHDDARASRQRPHSGLRIGEPLPVGHQKQARQGAFRTGDRWTFEAAHRLC